MWGWMNKRVIEKVELVAGDAISIVRYLDKIIINSTRSNTTKIKVGDHIIEGDCVEIEAGTGILVETSHPDKIKISFDSYGFFGNILNKLDKVERDILDIKNRLDVIEKGGSNGNTRGRDTVG